MNNLGRVNPTQYSASNPFNLDTGLSWQYIRIINNSPYLLVVSFGNQGSIDVPEMWLEDIPITSNYNGKLTIAPSVNINPANVNSSLSAIVSIVAYQASELSTPRAQPLGTPGGIGKSGQIVDALLAAFPSVNITINTPQNTPLGTNFLDISGVSTQNPGYLILGYFNCDMGRQTFLPTRGNKEVVYLQGQSVTVPGNVTGNTQQFTFGNHVAEYLTALLFFGIPTGVTITNVELKRSQDPVANYVFWPNFSNITTTTTISLVNTWGPDGFTNFTSGGGISIRLTMNNTNVGAASFSFNAYGYQLAYDEAVVIVAYEDWKGNTYELGTGKVGQLANWPLNFLVPIPITDPNQTNFGSISLTVISSIEFYNTNYTFDVTMPCFITQLAS